MATVKVTVVRSTVVRVNTSTISYSCTEYSGLVTLTAFIPVILSHITRYDSISISASLTVSYGRHMHLNFFESGTIFETRGNPRV